MDYAGAVYGEEGKVSFAPINGASLLTSEEEKYVIKKFGRPENSRVGIFSFLDRGRSKFFERLAFPDDPTCRRQIVGDPDRWSDPLLGKGLVLYGYHGCGQNYASQLTKSGLELSIGAEPQNWAFYLESYGVLDQRVQLEEVELFKRIGKALDIPLRNALPVRALSKEALQEGAKTSKYSEMDFAVAVFFQAVLGNVRQNPNVDPIDVADRLAPEVAKELGQDGKALRKAFDQYFKDFPDLIDAAKESDRRAKIIAELSNQLSQKKLKQDVEGMAKSHPNLKSLFMIGAMHRDLVREVYVTEKPPKSPD